MKESKNLVQVGEAVLTPEAIERLEYLQSSNKDNINLYVEKLVNLIFFGMKAYKELKEPKLQDSINELIYLRDIINDLKKP